MFPSSILTLSVYFSSLRRAGFMPPYFFLASFSFFDMRSNAFLSLSLSLFSLGLRGLGFDDDFDLDRDDFFFVFTVFYTPLFY